VCATRWVQKHEAVITLEEIIVPVSTALEEIDQWKDKDAASGAHSLLCAIQNSPFLVTLSILARIMVSSLVLSRALQKVQLDLVTAIQYADQLLSDLTDSRSRAEEEFAKIYKEASKLATDLGVTLQKPRTTTRQTHRDNLEPDTEEEYFRRSVYIPFLDRFITELLLRNKYYLRLIAATI